MKRLVCQSCGKIIRMPTVEYFDSLVYLEDFCSEECKAEAEESKRPFYDRIGKDLKNRLLRMFWGL